MSRRVIYSVASSLDGFIARPGGQYDWIPEDPAIDWGEFLDRFDTVLMGRRTYEVVADEEEEELVAGKRTIVFSRTLDPSAAPGVEVLDDDPGQTVGRLKTDKGRDIWLMGGGVLFRELLDAEMVDAVEVAVVPKLLGEGIPLLAARSGDVSLQLRHREEYPSGIVLLRYDVQS